jgi:hypothetical protein
MKGGSESPFPNEWLKKYLPNAFLARGGGSKSRKKAGQQGAPCGL